MTDNTVAKIETEAQHLPADPMVSMIERIAMDPNADLAKLEKMLDMKERLEEKQARRAFDMAMAEAKAEIPPILKSGTVDYKNSKGERTHFKHETLDGIAKVVDPILSKHGLSYRYRSKQENGQLYVTCVVAHRDGCSEETTLQGGPDVGAGKNNYQAVGSAATYLQRYTLKLALGLSAAQDDDGSAAGTDAPDTVTADQYIALRDKAAEAGVDEETICLAAGCADLHQFPADKFKSSMARLEKNLAARRSGGNV